MTPPYEPASVANAFRISFKFIRFGTTDPIQGAAFFLAFILILALVGAFITDLFVEQDLTLTFIDCVETPLMLYIGVAIGD